MEDYWKRHISRELKVIDSDRGRLSKIWIGQMEGNLKSENTLERRKWKVVKYVKALWWGLELRKLEEELQRCIAMLLRREESSIINPSQIS